MKNIYSDLLEFFKDVYGSADNTHTILKPALKNFIYIRYGIEIGDSQRCSLKGVIKLANEVPITAVYLNKEQTELFKKQKNFTSYKLVESYIGTPNQLILYVPDYAVYINNGYEPMDRLKDLSYTIYMILSAYFRCNLILQSERKLMCIYGSIVIALKVLSDLRICRIEEVFEGKTITIMDDFPLLLQNLKEIKDNSIDDLLVNKYIKELWD